MILYFSATGNSKYVAQRIAEFLGEKAVSILADDLPDEPIKGLVTPVYALGLPDIVEKFLLENKLQKQDYLFFVATYGTTPGQAAYFANKAFKSRNNASFNAFFSIKMPDTWTPMFDLSDQAKVAALNEAAEKETDAVIAQIAAKNRPQTVNRQTPFFTRPIYRPYYNWMRQTKNFHLEETCIGCGLCARKCPSNAIIMENSRPQWVKDKCTMCLRCLHHCPAFAIQYGKNTKTHGQYRNPHVSID